MNYTLGRFIFGVGQPEKATQAMARVFSQNPGSRQARLRMAQAQAQNKDLRGAITTLEEIVDDEPGVAAPLAQYQVAGRAAARGGGFLYARARRRANEPPARKARRILVLYDLKDYARAAALAAEAQKQHPDDRSSRACRPAR